MLNNWKNLSAIASSNGYPKITLEKMRTDPAKLSNFRPEVVQYVGYWFHDMIVSCMYGTENTQCNEAKCCELHSCGNV